MVSKKELTIIRNNLIKCENSLSMKNYDDALNYFDRANKRINFASLKLRDESSEKINIYLELLRMRNKLYLKLKDENLEKEMRLNECLSIRQVKSCEECSRYETENCRLVLMKKGRI